MSPFPHLLSPQAFLLLFLLYFCIHQCAVARREGPGYFLRPWNVAGLCSLSLCLAAAALQLSRAALSDRLWDSFRQRPGSYTNFYSLAFQNQAFTQVCSLLLFVLVLKVKERCPCSGSGAQDYSHRCVRSL